MKSFEQLALFPELFQAGSHRPVNVASVPQRSPFRYPGGKTWFVPAFRDWIKNRFSRPELLIEPFAGGGIISITALAEDLVTRVVMAEIDENVAAVWQAVIDGDADWLAKRILDFDLTEQKVIDELSRESVSNRERAFQTILRNRTLHGGILASGSGFIRRGENGKGIASRWYPETIAQRFLDLNAIAGRMAFRKGDGLALIREYSACENAVFFLDPPYTAGGKKAGRRLYTHFAIDHEYLFKVCQSVKGDFLMTYDDADEVKALARKHGFQMRIMPMKNTHHATMEELVIGRELSWMDHYPAVHEPSVHYKVDDDGE